MASALAEILGPNKKGIVITGDKETDRALKQLEEKVQKKALNQALRKTTTKVKNDYIARYPHNKNVTKKSTTVRVMKRSKKRKDVKGMMVFIDRKKLLKHYPAGYGRELEGYRKSGIWKFSFYPQFIEFAKRGVHKGRKPMRRALYDNAPTIRTTFVNNLRQAIKDQAAKAKKAPQPKGGA